ncbi:hypothetical protein Ahy_A09g044606 isoform C [Arachis hypogaea]|uniref:Uncharacterized protein n=1 Tax=Arachis hypogaea TaxID=3818 RepID=A0A445BKD2_ARAHY|nr:hypothetical protein Ahy_A09g044606 isoform C [Arachis hypogaea]
MTVLSRKDKGVRLNYNTTIKSLQAALLLSSLGSLLKRLKQEALSLIQMSSCSCVFHLPRPTSHNHTQELAAPLVRPGALRMASRCSCDGKGVFL